VALKSDIPTSLPANGGTAETLSKTLPIEKGGTGATTVAGARNALGLGNTSGALPIANGGTGATTATEALGNLGITASSSELNKLKGVTVTTDEINYLKDLTGNVQAQLNGKAAKSLFINTTLISTSWSGSSAPFSYTLSVNGVTSSNVVEIIPQSNLTVEQSKALASAVIATGTQTTNSITLKAFGKKPNINIPITIIVRGDV